MTQGDRGERGLQGKPGRPGRVRVRRQDRTLAVLMLGVIAVIAVIADFILLIQGADPPGGLLAVAGGCVGALATLVTAAPAVIPPEKDMPL